MDKFQSKASDIVNGYLKETQRRKDAKKARETPKRTKKIPPQAQLCNMQRINYCSYCNKAFSESGYLVKHILRRHPDELLQMHGQLMKESWRQREPETATQLKMLPTSIEHDITDIKQTLSEFKSQILTKLQLINSGDEPYSKRNAGPARKMHNASRTESGEFKKFCVELQELKLQCQNYEAVVQNLGERHRLALDALKHEMTSNEEVNKQNNAKMKRMMQNTVRARKKEITHIHEEVGKQLIAFRQIVTSDLQKQWHEWDGKLSNLSGQCASEVNELRSFMQANITKLAKAQNEENVEKMFERHLQNYLNKIAENPKKKHNVNKSLLRTIDGSQSSPNLRSTTSTKMPDIPGSRHITPKVHTMIPKRHGLRKSSKSQGKLTSSPKEFPGTNVAAKCSVESPPPKQCSFTCQKQKVRKPLFITKRVKAAMQSNPNVLDGFYEELSNAVEDKMQSLGFEPGQKRLSNSDFEAKKILVYNDLNQVSNKSNVLVLRNKIDDLITKKVKLYLLHHKDTKRIHFASPEVVMASPTVSSILGESKSMEEIIPCSSSGFIVGDLKSPSGPDTPQSVSLKNVPKSEETHKNRDLMVKTSLINIAETDFNEVDALAEELHSKLNLESSSADSDGSSSSLSVLMVQECPKETPRRVVNSTNKDQIPASSLFVRRQLKFQKDGESKVTHSVSRPDEISSLSANKHIHELDGISSLESLNSWDSNYDKLDIN